MARVRDNNQKPLPGLFRCQQIPRTSSLETPAGPEAEAGPVLEGEKKKPNLWRRAIGRRSVVDESKPFESVRDAVHLFGRKDSAKVPKENITKSRGGSYSKMSLQEQLEELRHECESLQLQAAEAREAEKLKAAELAHFRSIAQRSKEVEAQQREILDKSEADKERLEAQLEQHEEELGRLKEAKAALEVQLADAKASEGRRVAELEKEKELREDECQQARQLEHEASVKLESAIEQVKTLRRKSLELTEENQSKRELAAELSKAQEALRAAEGHIAKSKAAERLASKRSEQAQKDLEEAKSLRKVLEGELKGAKAAVERAERAQAAREQRVRHAESQVESSRAELAAAKAQALKVEGELELRVEGLQTQLANAQQALVAAQKEAKAAQEHISKLEKEVAASEAEVQRARESADSAILELKEKLSRALGELDQSKEAAKGLQVRLLQAEEEMKVAEAEGSLKLAMVRKDIDALKAKLAETVAEADAAQVKASDLECKLAMVELDAKAAREGQKAAEAAVGVLKEQVEKVEHLAMQRKGQLEALQAQGIAEKERRALVEAELKQKEERVAEVEQQVEELEDVRASLEEEVAQKEEENADLEDQLRALEDERIEALESVAHLEEKLVCMVELVKAFKERVAHAEQEAQAGKEGEALALDTVARSKSWIADLEAKLSAACGDQEALTGLARRLEGELEVARGRLAELGQKLLEEREEARLILAEELEKKSLAVAELEERLRIVSEEKSQAMVACRGLEEKLQVAVKRAEEASQAFARLEGKIALAAKAEATEDREVQGSGKLAVKKVVATAPGVLERGLWIVVDGGLWVLETAKVLPLVGRAVTAVERRAVPYAQPLLEPWERKCLEKVVEVDNSICALYKAFDEHTPLVRLGSAALWPAQVAVSVTHQTLSLPWEALVVLRKGVATVKDELLSPVLGDLKQSGMMSALATLGVRLEPLLEQEVSLAFTFAEKIPVISVFVPVLLPVGDRVLKLFHWATNFEEKRSRRVRRLQPAGPSTECEG